MTVGPDITAPEKTTAAASGHPEAVLLRGDSSTRAGDSSMRAVVLTKRADFLKAAKARRQSTTAFILQARLRADAESDVSGMRVGFTCSKKVGNAVARNRAKRRLREIARLTLPDHGRPGWDYVLVGRPVMTASRDFAQMLRDLEFALSKVHA